MKFRQLELFGEEAPVAEAEPSPVPGPDAVPEALPAAEPPAPEVPLVQTAESTTAPRSVSETPVEEELPAATTQAPPVLKRSRRQARHAARDAPQIIELPPDELLYARQYYGIGEVAAMFQVKVSVLRYWESEFEVLDLRKNRKGDRFFRPDDVKTVRLIYHLLRERKFTIEGARVYIRQHSRVRDRVEAIETLRRIRGFLVGIRSSLTGRTPSV